MSARDRLAEQFPLDCRVTMTKLGIDRLWPSHSRPSTVNGTVVGYSRDGRCIRVRREGHVDADTYSPLFWARSFRKSAGEGAR